MAQQRTADLYLSVVSVGEIERGILQQRPTTRTGPAQTFALYGERILAVDLSAARRWGRLSGELGHDSADLLIAASALEHGLTVVTRNVRHFEPTGVAVFDPTATPA